MRSASERVGDRPPRDPLRLTAAVLGPPLIVAAVFWVAIGRAFFDVGGWVLLVTLFALGPVVLVVLSIGYGCSLTAGLRRPADAVFLGGQVALLGTALSSLLFGVALDDTGDDARVPSMLENAGLTEHRSDTLAAVGFVAMVLGAIGYVALAAVDVHRKSRGAPAPAGTDTES